LFGFVQYDSPLLLVFELVLAVAVILVILWLARLVNRGSNARQVLEIRPNDKDHDAQVHSTSASADVPQATGPQTQADDHQ
jgi:hypothetical protein